MFRSYQILVSRLGLVASAVVLVLGLSACGQTGALYLPTDLAAANRATLPKTLKPNLPATQQTPTTPTSPAPSTNK